MIYRRENSPTPARNQTPIPPFSRLQFSNYIDRDIPASRLVIITIQVTEKIYVDTWVYLADLREALKSKKYNPSER
jgi:hypothetical protein